MPTWIAVRRKSYWDEHSLDEQRFYDTICLIYGHAPDKYFFYLIMMGRCPNNALSCAAKTMLEWKVHGSNC